MTSETPLRSAATYADPLEAAATPAELGKPMVYIPEGAGRCQQANVPGRVRGRPVPRRRTLI